MSDKVTRVAFLYLEPKERDNKEEFAQCGSCRMFVPDVYGLTGSRCIIHGSYVEIDDDDSCGFWVDWPTPDAKPNPQVVADHAHELSKKIPGSVTPEESGLVDERVQCHRCEFYGAQHGKCHLYEALNRGLPEMFDLVEAVKPNACCNAWTENDNDGDEGDEPSPKLSRKVVSMSRAMRNKVSA